MDYQQAFWLILYFVMALDVPAILVLQFFYAREFKRRPHYRWRMAGVAVILLAGQLGMNLFYEYGEFLDMAYIFSIAISLIYFIGMFACFFLLYKESFYSILVCFILTYISYFIPYQILCLGYNCAGLDWASSNEILCVYGAEKLALDVVCDVILYFVFIRRIRSIVYVHRDGWMIGILLYSFVTSTVLDGIREQYAGVYYGNEYVLNLVLNAFIVINCIFILYIVYIYIRNAAVRHDNEMLQIMRRQEKQQYEARKENTAALNIKSHDLKHFLNMLQSGESTAATAELSTELQKIVSKYDSDIHTGCGPLDIILSENSALCAANSIILKCVIDGSALSFISELDIYSMFGNILSNSIEYLKQVEDKDKRVCLISVRKAKAMTFIHQENYFGGKLNVSGGEIRTTKKDTINHGYGLKSISAIAEKYGGQMTVSTENELFTLNIMLINKPVAEPAEA